MQLPTKVSFVVLILALCAGCSSTPSTPTVTPAPARYQYVQLLMGVQVRLVVYTIDENHARSACKAAYERLADIEEMMSDYQRDSELMRLCSKSGNGPVKVSPELFEVLSYAQGVSDRSDGAFDVTVGPLVQLWRQARKTGKLPDPSALADAKKRVGWKLMRLDPANQTVDLTIPGMRLDLGGIAKGYAGDEAIRVLRDHGIKSALFEAGGDIVVSDPPPNKPGWEIETTDLDQGQHRRVSVHNAAVSTSGDSEQFVDIDGIRYSHVVDPHTGLGLTEHYAATVIAPRGITTDALSTAATVLGPDAGKRLVDEYPGARAYIRKIPPQISRAPGSTTSPTNP